MRRLLPANPDRWSFARKGSPSLRSDFPSIPPVHPHESPNEVLESLSRGVFEHLNLSHSLGRDHPDWRLGPCTVDRLWTITLHYHEWAYELARIAAGELFTHYIDDWMANCGLDKPGARDLAWNPYAIATRIGWWVRSIRAQTPPRAMSESDPSCSEGETALSSRGWGPFLDADFRGRFLSSLWQQARYLSGHVEWDLRANHLLRDAVGLAWAGRFFDEPESRKWLRTAERIAVEQAEEQVLPDGGHFERTPMYHIHVMEDFLILTRLLEDPDATRAMREACERMAECLAWMRHPDGEIPLLNDAALGCACLPDDMLDQVDRMVVQRSTAGSASSDTLGRDGMRDARQGAKLFPHFGVFAWRGEPWTVFFDVGPVGVRYQLGHAHADTLTIEASFHGKRFLVDPGTWAYDQDVRREYDRSTAAHNTVCVDGHNSSEVWHIFRCGRTAQVHDVHMETDLTGFKVTAGHTGYRYLPGRALVEREVILHPSQQLVVTDRCSGRGDHRLTGGWLLDPGWEARDSAGGWHVSRPGCGSVSIQIRGSDGLKLQRSSAWYHPEFGIEHMTTRLEWILHGSLPAEVTTVFTPDCS